MTGRGRIKQASDLNPLVESRDQLGWVRVRLRLQGDRESKLKEDLQTQRALTKGDRGRRGNVCAEVCIKLRVYVVPCLDDYILSGSRSLLCPVDWLTQLFSS